MSSLEARATALVSPASGMANDYLNHFNEVLLMIENLPVLLPEMVDELVAWKPVSYRDYFELSNLPGSAEALAIYDNLDEDFRKEAEIMIGLLDRIILESVSIITSHRRPDGTIEARDIEEVCAKLADALRAVLERMSDMVNHGYANATERMAVSEWLCEPTPAQDASQR
jgi:hypothetical protein